MSEKTEEARRLASELRSVIPPKNHEASRILDSAAFTLRLLAADVNKLKAENEALRADRLAVAEAVREACAAKVRQMLKQYDRTLLQGLVHELRAIDLGEILKGQP